MNKGKDMNEDEKKAGELQSKPALITAQIQVIRKDTGEVENYTLSMSDTLGEEECQ